MEQKMNEEVLEADGTKRDRGHTENQTEKMVRLCVAT